MAQSTNLPGFDTELVDGGLTVTVQNTGGDPVAVIGFSALGYDPSGLILGGIASTVGQPVLINAGPTADAVYGISASGSSIEKTKKIF